MAKKYDFVVIGGGLVGCTACLSISSKGKSVCLIEKNKNTGEIMVLVLQLPHLITKLQQNSYFIFMMVIKMVILWLAIRPKRTKANQKANQI